MSGESLPDSRIPIRKQAWLTLLLVAALSFTMFAASTQTHLRMDWTEDQIYSLSDSTRTVLSQLDEPILIRAYITSDMPQPYGRLKRFLEDMLIAYHEAGHGKIGYEMVDPAENPNVEAALQALKVPKVQVQVIEDDRAQIKQGYLAVVIEYLDKKEVIPVVQGEEGFEYLLTRKIKKLTGKGRMKVGVVSAFGSTDLFEMQKLKALLADDYQLLDVLPQEKAISDEIKVLIVAGMDKKPSELFRYRVDQFRMRGGGLMVLAGQVEPLLNQGFKVQAVQQGAHDWLKSDLGVSVEAGLVMDQHGTRVTVNNRQGMFMFQSLVDYPFIPDVTELHASHPVTRDLESIVLPFPSPLLWASDEKKDLDRTVLLHSSQSSSIQAGTPFDVDPMVSMVERFNGVTLQSSVMAIAQQGKMESSFEQAPKDAGEAKHISVVDHGRLLLVGSSALLSDDFMDGGNLVAVLNMLDWISGEEALIDLRSRGVTERPLAQLSSEGRAFFKGLWMFAMPVFIVFLGLFRFWRLRRRQSV
ncbi:MAG: GldG family protein [Mariprofundaceae bacterium]